VTPPPADKGFGSKLLDRVVTRQLRGSVSYIWPVEGMIATLRVKTANLGL
jgi:two-component sensor histidine kinase